MNSSQATTKHDGAAGARARPKVIRVDARDPAADAIQQAAETIRGGGLVAFPTETVYGLGADAWSESAVQRIFAAKGRPANDPLIVHIADLDQLPQVAREIPGTARKLCRRFWPGPLTLILPKQAAIPAVLTAGLDTVAVRLPAHPVALSLLRAAAVPIAAPSANRFARPSPTTAQHVLDDLADAVDLVLDAGSASIGLESTIVSLIDDEATVLRPGGVPLEALRQVVPGLRLGARYLGEAEVAPAPGSLLRHYSPRARVILFQGEADAAVYAAMRAEIARHDRVGVLAADAELEAFRGLDIEVARLGATQEEAAARLFAALRSLDERGVDVILARSPAAEGLGLALRDRLLRAAVGHVVRV